MSNEPHVIYRLREDATAEAELDAVAAVYAYLLKNRKAARAAPEPDDCDGTRIEGDSTDARIIPE
jgi:hypothetical protein